MRLRVRLVEAFRLCAHRRALCARRADDVESYPICQQSHCTSARNVQRAVFNRHSNVDNRSQEGDMILANTRRHLTRDDAELVARLIERSRENLEEFIRDGILVRDPEPGSRRSSRARASCA